MADDLYRFSDPFAESAPAAAEDKNNLQWGDYLNALKVGTTGLRAGFAGAQQYVLEKVSQSPEAMKDSPQELERRALILQRGLEAEDYSPAAKRVKAQSLFPKEGQESAWGNLRQFIIVNGLESAPSIMASVVPAILAAPVIGATGATLAAGAVGGAANAGDLFNDLSSSIEKKSDEELREIPAYAAYRNMMDEENARAALRSDVVGFKPVISAAFTILTSKFGLESLVARRTAGEAVVGRGRAALIGGLGEGAQEFGENLLNKTMSGAAQKEYGLTKAEWGEIWEDALREAIDGAVVAGVIGGGLGAATGTSARRAEKPTPAGGVNIVQPGAPDPAQEAALGASAPQPQPAQQPVQPSAPVAEAAPAAPQDGVTVPETLDSLQDQQEKLVSGDIPAMLFPWTQKPARGVQGRTQELALPDGFDRVTTREGVVHFDPKVFNRQTIITAVDNGRINDILGYVQSKEEVAAAQAAGDGPARTIVERGPNGEERGAAVVSPSQEAAQVEMFRRRQSPDSTIVRETPEQTLAQRMQNAPPFARSTPRPVNPEQEYWEAFDDYRAEQAASEPVEAYSENVGYDAEPETGVQLTPEQNGRLWFINETRAADEKMTPEEFLVSGEQEYQRLTAAPPPAAPAKLTKGEAAKQKAQERAAEKAAKAEAAKQKAQERAAKKAAPKSEKVAKAVATAAPDAGPLFTAPVNQTPAAPKPEKVATPPAQDPRTPAAEQAVNEVKLASDSGGFTRITYPGGSMTVEAPAQYGRMDKARRHPGFSTNGKSITFFTRDAGYQGERAGAAFIDEIATKGAVPPELHQVFRDILKGKLSSSEDITLAVRRARMEKILESQPKSEPVKQAAPKAEPGPLFTAPVNQTPSKPAKVEQAVAVAKKTEPAPAPAQPAIGRVELSTLLKKRKEERESKGKNRTREEKETLQKQDDFGKEAVKREPGQDEFYADPKEDDLLRGTRAQPSQFVRTKGQRKALEKRLQKVLDDAKAASVNIEDRSEKNPTGLQTKIFAETPDGVMYLRVAKDMLKLLKQNRTSAEATQALNDFIVEEQLARKGDFSAMRSRRQVEGDMRNRRSGGDIENVGPKADAPDKVLEANEAAFRKELAMQEIDRLLDGMARGDVKQITEDDIKRIREIAGKEADNIDLSKIREALAGNEEKPAVFKRKKEVTAEDKPTKEPTGKSLKSGSLNISEEELARIADEANKAAARGSLTDAEMARDRQMGRNVSADEWLKANDPNYSGPLFSEAEELAVPRGELRTEKARDLIRKGKQLSRAQRAELEEGLTQRALIRSKYDRWGMVGAIEDEVATEQRLFTENGETYVRTVVRDKDGNEVVSPPARVIETRTLNSVMSQLVRDNVADGPLFEITQKIIERNGGNTPVHFISDEDMRAVRPDADGFFDPVANHIVLPDRFRLWAGMASSDISEFFGVDAAKVEQSVFNHTVLHEGAHAALRHQLFLDRIAVGQLRAIGRELLAAMNKTDPNYGKRYLFANAQEFLAEALSNGARQRDMRSVNISRGLAKALGLPIDQNISLWRAFVLKAADWLGLGDRLKSNIDALDAVLSVVERIENGGLAPSSFPVLPPGWSKYFAPEGTLALDVDGLTAEWELKNSGYDALGPDLLPTSRDDLTDRGKSFKSWLSRAAVKGSTLDQMRQLYRGLFRDSNGDALERVVEGIQRIAPYAAKKRERAEQLAQRFIDYSRNSTKEAAELADLAIDATMSNVQLGPTANNRHLDQNWRGWQGKKQLAGMQRRYDAMSEEGRALYNDMAKFYRDMQNEMTEGLVNNILDEIGVNPPNRQAFVQRVMDGKMTAADETLLAGKPTALKALKEAREVRAVKGDYFPLMRNGDYVVVTEDNIRDLMGGTEVEPGKVEFRGASRKAAMDAAKAFAEASPLRVINLQQSPDTATSTDFGVVVTVQKKGVFFFESETEANKWRRENEGNFDQVSQVQDRLQTARTSADLTTAQFNSLMGSIERQTDDPTVKATMKGIMEQAAARMMSGNRIQQRSIARRNVQGASKDFGRNLVQYGQAAGGYLAKIKYMPSVREALKSMTKLANDGMSGDTPQRVRVLNEITQRIDQGIIEPNDPPKWLSDLMTLTYLGKLFSPMYSVINGMQPWMVTQPVLAGRYGAMRAASALSGAYRALGFTDAVGGGLRNTLRAGRQFTSAGLLDTTDVPGSIKKKLAAQTDGAELVKVIDMALERGAMSAGGFEMAQALAEGRGQWGTNLSRVDRIARQLPQAIEDVNRAVTLVAAYRLARGANMSEEKAAAYAFDTVMNTQGDYSAVNAPRFFANPYLRPALQFKKYAQMMTFLLSDMVHRSFKGATPEERSAARKQLLNVLSVQIAMAGVLSLPGLEIAKLSFMLAAALGFGDGWDDQEEKLRKLADDTFGKTWGELISRGLLTRAINIDLSQRLSLADMWTFGEPKKYDKDNLNAYLAQLLFGAPGSTAADFFNGLRDVGKGDMLKGAGQMLPIKFISDSFKAANNYSQGKATAIEVGMNTFGVRSGRQAEQGREVGAKIRERDALQKRYKELSDRYLKSRNAGERAVIRAQIVEHNKTAPLRYKVFPGALDKVRERIDAERVN